MKNSTLNWLNMAKTNGLVDDQMSAAMELMVFIQEEDIDSAEMDTNTEWKKTMVNLYFNNFNICVNLKNFAIQFIHAVEKMCKICPIRSN